MPTSLVATWTHRELPEGDTVAERCARRPGLPAAERDLAHRAAPHRVGAARAFCVVCVQPSRWIELDEPPAGPATRVLSRDASRTVRRDDMLVARLMEGHHRRRCGPRRELDARDGRDLVDLLGARAQALGAPGDLGTLMPSDSREITTLLAPGLAR